MASRYILGTVPDKNNTYRDWQFNVNFDKDGGQIIFLVILNSLFKFKSVQFLG